MTVRAIWLALAVACLFGCLLSSGQITKAPPSKYALLIGIGKYKHPPRDIKAADATVPRVGRDAPDLTYFDLVGPANDIQGEGELFNLLGDPHDQRHAENTLVPYDWNTGVDDIFSRDLRHFYREAVDKGIHVTAIFDACHSGDLGRGLIKGKRVPREFDFDPREMPPNPYAKEERSTLPQNDPVTPVLILSAAQRD